jgi:hypothetical protein
VVAVGIFTLTNTASLNKTLDDMLHEVRHFKAARTMHPV